MPYMDDSILDAALNEVAAADALHICSQEPTTYAEATATYSLGSKASPSIGAPANGSPDGRAVQVAAITDGAVTADGTASHYALVDTSGTRLLVADALTNGQVVTNGNPFTLDAFNIRFPDPV